MDKEFYCIRHPTAVPCVVGHQGMNGYFSRLMRILDQVGYIAAAKTVGANKEKYAEAEARANATRPERPVWFHPYSHYAPSDDVN